MNNRKRLLAVLGSVGVLAALGVLIGFGVGSAATTTDAGSGTAGPGSASPTAGPAPSDGVGITQSGGSTTHDDEIGDSGHPTETYSGGPGETSTCGSGEFRIGDWLESAGGDPGDVSGISAAGDDECARLRISFDGPVPGVRLWRPSAADHTSISLAPGGEGHPPPYGPVDPDLLWPDLELLSAAMLTYDGTGLAVKALHGGHTDVAARAVLAEHHVDVYFRSAHPDDLRVNDRWHGGPRHVEVTGAPESGLAVLHAAGYDDAGDGGWVRVEGYAKSPESNVVMRVHERYGDGLICEQILIAAGPPYLFSWFGETCAVPRDGPYHVQVGWSDPARTELDVWHWVEVTVG